MSGKIGFELEMIVLDKDYNESNKADLIIEEAKKLGVSCGTECSHSMVEVNSIPGDIGTSANDLLNQIESVNDIAERLGLKVLPIEMPINHDFRPIIRDSPRYDAKKKLLGEDRFEISGKVMGFHVHYDLPPDDDKKLDQINFLKLVDPLAVSASASSPFSYGGVEYDSWRTHSYRYIVHEELPFQGQLQKFNPTYEKYVEEHFEKYNSFLEMTKQKDIDFSEYADEYNSIWGPTRINPGYNTSEIRSMGSTPDLAMLFGLASIISGGIKKLTSGYESENLFLDVLSEVDDPNEKYNFIQALSDDAMKYGLDSATVKNYCNFLINYCDASLDSQEKKFADYSTEKINSDERLSDIISSNLISPKEKYSRLHDLYVNSIKQSRELLEEK